MAETTVKIMTSLMNMEVTIPGAVEVVVVLGVVVVVEVAVVVEVEVVEVEVVVMTPLVIPMMEMKQSMRARTLARNIRTTRGVRKRSLQNRDRYLRILRKTGGLWPVTCRSPWSANGPKKGKGLEFLEIGRKGMFVHLRNGCA